MILPNLCIRSEHILYIHKVQFSWAVDELQNTDRALIYNVEEAILAVSFECSVVLFFSDTTCLVVFILVQSNTASKIHDLLDIVHFSVNFDLRDTGL